MSCRQHGYPWTSLATFPYGSSPSGRSSGLHPVSSHSCYGCTTWTLTKRLEKKLDGNYTRMLRAILNKSWRQPPHETPTVRPPASHHENYTGQTSQTHQTLLEKQRRARKWRTTMDLHIWPSKSRTTSPNLHIKI